MNLGWLKWLALGIGSVLVAKALSGSAREVSAWTGASAIANPASAIALAKTYGVGRLCVFVNDSSYTKGAFRTYSRYGILACVRALKSAGLAVSLVSWMTPDPDWTGRGADELAQLARDAGVDELELDMEEPWTVIRERSNADIKAIATGLVQRLRRFSGKLGIDFIVTADMRALGPVAALVDFLVPQAYRVYVNRNFPDIERQAFERWSTFGKSLVLGIAGYWRSSPFEAGRAEDLGIALSEATRLGITRVRLWRLEMLHPELGRELIAWRAGNDNDGRNIA